MKTYRRQVIYNGNVLKRSDYFYVCCPSPCICQQVGASNVDVGSSSSKLMNIDAPKENRWIKIVMTTHKKGVLALLCSLLNTTANYGSQQWHIP
jgi:hypothetical protein